MMDKIKALRADIEQIDALIIEKIAQRRALAREIGQIKAQSGMDVFDPLREAQLMAFYESLAQRYDVNIDTIREIFRLIMTDAKKVQMPPNS